MTITREQIEADKAMCEKATEGPWEGHTEKDGPCVWSTISGARKWVMHAGGFTRTRGGESEEHYGVFMSTDDLAFSTRARTALPEYIAELEALRGRYDALFTIATQILDTEQHSGRPYCDDRFVPGGPIRALRKLVRGAK